MKRLSALTAAALTALALNASAGVLTVSGSNVAGNELYVGFPAARVDFNVTSAGVYTFETLNANFDTFIELYTAGLALPAAAFNPLAFDDDGSAAACGVFFCSKLADLSLDAGVYSLFIRGSSGETGTFQLRLQSVQGPEVLLVPEPTGLAALGLGLMVLTTHRRRGKGRAAPGAKAWGLAGWLARATHARAPGRGSVLER